MRELLDSVPADAVVVPFEKALLLNQFKALNTQNGGLMQPVTRPMKKMLMRIAHRVIRNLVGLQDIVGVQPMTMPVGLVYTLQYSKESNDTSIKLEILTHAVQALSRKLQAGWTIEAQQDTNRLHKLDFESELTHMMADEIVYELYREVISDIIRLGQKVVFSFDPALTNMEDKIQSLMIQINKSSNDIARRSRRGCGNVIITTPMVISMLQSNKSLGGMTFVPSDATPIYTGELTHFGNMVNTDGSVRYKVLSSLSVSNVAGKDQIVVLYKGTSEVDTGYIYCPFVPLLSTGVVVDPATFQPCVHFMTRYGKYINEVPDDMSNSGNYYQVIEVDTMSMLGIEPAPVNNQ
jgi:hypothetical protein